MFNVELEDFGGLEAPHIEMLPPNSYSRISGLHLSGFSPDWILRI
jgi:hypothetical protein